MVNHDFCELQWGLLLELQNVCILDRSRFPSTYCTLYKLPEINLPIAVYWIRDIFTDLDPDPTPEPDPAFFVRGWQDAHKK